LHKTAKEKRKPIKKNSFHEDVYAKINIILHKLHYDLLMYRDHRSLRCEVCLSEAENLRIIPIKQSCIYSVGIFISDGNNGNFRFQKMGKNGIGSVPPTVVIGQFFSVIKNFHSETETVIIHPNFSLL
jgi:hypothetical protein